jgi:hypothetical protein
VPLGMKNAPNYFMFLKNGIFRNYLDKFVIVFMNDICIYSKLEVRSFMGLPSYYMRFIGGFSNIAHPITYLKKKKIKFEWTSKCEENFHIF